MRLEPSAATAADPAALAKWLGALSGANPGMDAGGVLEVAMPEGALPAGW